MDKPAAAVNRQENLKGVCSDPYAGLPKGVAPMRR
jgi:hypothetical protein